MVKPHREKVPAQSEVVHPTFMVTVEIPTEVPSCDNITGDSAKLQNSHILANFQSKVEHLSTSRQAQLSSLVHEFVDVFPDVPRQTNVTMHDVEVGEACPIKQHPYRINPLNLR